MKDTLQLVINGVTDKQEMKDRIKACAMYYEERAAKDLDMINNLCNYLNNSELTPFVAEGYAIVISDIAQTLKRWLTDEGKKIVNPQNATQDAKTDEDHIDIGVNG